MKRLGIKVNQSIARRRSTRAVQKDVKKLEDKIRVSDEIEGVLEDKYVSIIEDMIAGKV